MEIKNVLSLFDGMSCGQIALNEAGINYENYYASEIEKEPIQVTMRNYPNTIQLGSVMDLVNIDWSEAKINLLIGGSPCQSFSFAGSAKGLMQKGVFEITDLETYLELKSTGFKFEGQSFLFWEYVRILNEIKLINPEIKFILENVKMAKKWQDVISKALGVEPKPLNAKDFSAQNRPRLFWTNIRVAEPPKNDLIIYDILDEGAEFNFNYAGWMLNNWGEKRRLDQFFNANGKASCLSASMAKGQKPSYCVNDEKAIHKYTVSECERLQTVPVGYTSGVSNGARYKMLGNGWNVKTIVHIFKGLK